MSFAVKDESIIKKADDLIEGQGDGRISKEDMRKVCKLSDEISFNLSWNNDLLDQIIFGLMFSIW